MVADIRNTPELKASHMTPAQMENCIKEVEHSLAVEYMAMTQGEKENLRRVARGELTYQELIDKYLADKKQSQVSLEDSIQSDHKKNQDPYTDSKTGVLCNKLGLRDPDELHDAERAIVGVTLAEQEEYPVSGNYDLEHLQSIHKALFDHLYQWAGDLRKNVFISKGNSLFCSAEFIMSYSVDLFAQLKAENYLQNLKRDDFIKRAAFYISEINALHPFREGNGRTQRIFIRQVAKQAGWNLNFTSVDPASLRNAYIASMTSTTKLEMLLEQTLKPY